MKTIDFFCASQASTAVSLPTADQASSAAIDRHNPIISDGRRSFTSRTFPNPPCSSQYSPINPLPYHHLHAAAATATPNLAADQIGSNKKKTNGKKSSSIIRTDIVRWTCAKPSDLVTPPSSMRYLSNDKSVRDESTDRLSPSVISSESNQKITQNIENPDHSNPTTEILPWEDCKTSPPSIKSQVVVLRASLHCRGCERKLKKHLSKMEGVNSFNIDFAAKKVTIMGNITPEGVLESVSKVKNAQFWPSAADPLFLQNPNLNHHQQQQADLLLKKP